MLMASLFRCWFQMTLAGWVPLLAGISPDQAVVASEGQRTFVAEPAQALDWHLDRTDAGSLEVLPGGGSARYSAPLVMATTTVQLCATDSAGSVHTARITVAPHPAWRTMEEVWGRNWKEPRLEILAGKAEDESTAFPCQVRDIKFVDDPGLGKLHRSWIICDATGAHVLPAAGAARPLGEGPGLPAPIQCPGLALRPPGSPAENRLHLVFSDYREATVRAWDPRGGARILAGDLERGGWQDGPHATFSLCNMPVLDRNGNTFVADLANGLVRRIAPDGTTATIAGKKGRRGLEDGVGAAATFFDLRDMTLDLDTGILYVADQHAVRSIAPDGTTRTLLGQVLKPGFQVEEGVPVPEGVPCLNGPMGLQAHRGRLFIADTLNHAIRVFDLDTRILRTLAGDPSQPLVREGPLRCFQPGRPVAECAALRRPASISINGDGACLVGMESCIVQLELADLNQSARVERSPGSSPISTAFR
jgi:hypothetical protein